MSFTKTVVVVHGQLFTCFDGPQAGERAIFFHFDVGFFGVVQVDGHVHGVHAHHRNLERLFIVIAKKFDVLLHTFGEFFDLFV